MTSPDTRRAVPPAHPDLRRQVREFLRTELARGTFQPRCDAWLSASDRNFTKKLADQGWLGMSLPTEYGGHGRSALERFVVIEELLAAGAPVAAHWIADRQMAPSLLRFGTEAQKNLHIPAIVRGDSLWCIGMSEPDSGSDLASIRTRAVATSDGWLINGSKIWTTGAQHADFIMALVRTSPKSDQRHAGMSQFIVPLTTPGVEVSPIRSMDGEHHFNEVFFDNVAVPREALLGTAGDGWHQVTSELSFERSGPERILSTLPLLTAWAEHLQQLPIARREPASIQCIGRLISRMWALRRMSMGVAAAVGTGNLSGAEASMVKDLGTQFERDVAMAVSEHAGVQPDLHSGNTLQRMIAEAILHSPGFTLRGGTTEVLRGIVSKNLDIS